jgi:hypothetical protein
MAREAGFEHIAEADYWHPLFERFATLVIKSLKPSLQIEFEKMFMEGAAAERKQIIEMAESSEFNRIYGEFSPTSTDLVRAIRSRNKE